MESHNRPDSELWAIACIHQLNHIMLSKHPGTECTARDSHCSRSRATRPSFGLWQKGCAVCVCVLYSLGSWLGWLVAYLRWSRSKIVIRLCRLNLRALRARERSHWVDRRRCTRTLSRAQSANTASVSNETQTDELWSNRLRVPNAFGCGCGRERRERRCTR